MLKSCPRCPSFVPADRPACPACGAPHADAAPSRAPGLLARLGTLAGAGAAAVTLMACYGAPIDDVFISCTTDADCGPGFVCDTATQQCLGSEVCGNGFDDDGDGFTDFDDDDCANADFERSCEDGIDDDEDGKIDCDDLDCAGASACLELCSDGLDNDADGLVDCQDSDCPACPTVETSCDNTLDDDLDGFVDCDDPDCASLCTPAVCGDGLVTPPEQCDDGAAVDGDGCSATCSVEIETFCGAIPTLLEGPTDGQTATGFVSGSCVGAQGLEAVYGFTAPADGTLFLSLDAAADLGVYVLDACGPGSGVNAELACQNQLLGNQVESLQLPLVLGQEIVVVVDSTNAGPPSPFQLITTFVPN